MDAFRGSPVAKLAFAFLHESVMSHNDLLSGNILYDPSWNRVQVIDYEYGTSYNKYVYSMRYVSTCILYTLKFIVEVSIN